MPATTLIIFGSGVGQQGPAGPIGVNWRDDINSGTWVNTATYAIRDGVLYNGTSYRSLVGSNTGNQPDTSPASWEIIAQQGVTGSAGATGATGATGPAGLVHQGTYAAGTTYALNDSVLFDGSTYRSLTNSNVGNQPDISPASWALVAKGTTAWDIAGFTLTLPTNAAVLQRFLVARAFSLPINLTGSRGRHEVTPTGATVNYPIKKNGASIGTIDYTNASNVATFTFAAGVSFVAGDVLTIEAPATADATHDGLSWNLVGVLA